MDPRKPAEFKKLVEAVKESFRKMQDFRENRKNLISAFVGSEYSGEGESKKVYLHLLTMAVNIYVRNLIARTPAAQITTPHKELRPLAANFQLACKDVAQETKLGETLKLCATDALFSPRAVAKVGLEYTGRGDADGTEVDLTEPFVRKVSFDDYVIDMSARSAGRPAFEGDRYYVSKDEFERRFPKKWTQLGLSEADLGVQNDGGEDRAEALSHAPGLGDENIKSQVELWDIFLPDTGDVVTFCAAKPEKSLAVFQLDGPEEGLYQSVWFTAVPDNALGMPHLGTLKNIHELANSMFRRIAAQARKQKRLVGFSDEESANRFKTAHDGDGVYWNGQKPESLEVGGIDQVNLATFIHIKDLFSWTAGNLDSMGGLSPMAETATQDEMLAQSSGAMTDDMRDAMVEFASRVFRQIAWYEWTDPIRVRTLQKEIPGTGDYIAVEWAPETKEADFLDFNFEINPYSLRDDSPDRKIAKLRSIIMDFYGPLQPFFQMQGITIDVRRLNELVADYTNLPELSQLIVDMNGQMIDALGAAGPQGGMKPPETKRTYERINRPGATRVGKDYALMQTLMGGKAQPSEAAAAGRAVG